MDNKCTFRNINWTKRDYESENLVACRAVSAPAGNWVPCNEAALSDLTMLYRQAGVEYWGYL